jgi:hypothetical protein
MAQSGASVSSGGNSSFHAKGRRQPRGEKPLDYEQKSLFVGSGLAFRRNEALEQELRQLQKGSTKQLLRSILGSAAQQE